MTEKNLLVIDGPSAVGKSTIVNYILFKQGDEFEIAKRVTTRTKRNSNEDDQSYEFINELEFRQLIKDGELVEYKDYLFGMSYGLPKVNISKCFHHGKNALAIINLGNGPMVKKNFPKAFCVFIYASIETIKKRLENRGIHTVGQLNERLNNAKKAEKFLSHYDLVIINENTTIDESVDEILKRFEEHNKT
jgi:guanylate kinase